MTRELCFPFLKWKELTITYAIIYIHTHSLEMLTNKSSGRTRQGTLEGDLLPLRNHQDACKIATQHHHIPSHKNKGYYSLAWHDVGIPTVPTISRICHQLPGKWQQHLYFYIEIEGYHACGLRKISVLLLYCGGLD